MILQLEYFPLLLIIYLFYSLLIANGLSFKDIYSTGKDFDITCIFADLTETLVALNNEGPTYPKTIHFNLKKTYTEQKKKGILNLVLNYAFSISI